MRLHVNAPACKINIKLHGQCIVNKTITYGLTFGVVWSNKKRATWSNGHIIFLSFLSPT